MFFLLQKKFLCLFLILVICLPFFPLCDNIVFATSTSLTEWNHSFSKEELAYHWAPIWKQNTVEGHGIRDYLLKFDFDGDMIGNNNWDSLASILDSNQNNDVDVDLGGYIYYSVVETDTHWFIGYYSFHPQDWGQGLLSYLFSEVPDDSEHENDMEGALLVIKKTIDDFGSLFLMETSAHYWFYQYTTEPESKWDDMEGEESIEDNGNILFGENEFSNHPILFLEAGGHGVYGHWKDAGKRAAKDWDNGNFPNNDGIVYYPTGNADQPENGNDRNVGYALIEIEELWNRRYDIGNGHTFGEFGKFNGDGEAIDSANAPWVWDQSYTIAEAYNIDADGPTFAGEIFYNPADMIDVHLNNLGDFSHDYIFNPYCIKVTILDYTVFWDKDPEGGDGTSDAYFNLFMFDGKGETHYDGVLDGDDGLPPNWVRDSLEISQIADFFGGTQHSWIGVDFPLYTKVDMSNLIKRSFYGIQYPGKPLFGIRSREWDRDWKVIITESLSEYIDAYVPNPDEWLMDVEETHWYWYGSGQSIYKEHSSPNYHNIHDGIYEFNWGGSEATILVDGNIDDDTDPPKFSHFTVDPERIPFAYHDSVVFTMTVKDASGIRDASFQYKEVQGPKWVTQKADIVCLVPETSGYDGVYLIQSELPKTVWFDYIDNAISFRWYAQDDDCDRPGDALEAYSKVYEKRLIQPFTGTNPSTCENILAFQTLETEEGKDLDGNLFIQNKNVIRYLDSHGNIINTGMPGENPSTNGEIIAFNTNEIDANRDLNGDGDLEDTVIQYYVISSGITHTISDGIYPSISDELLSFEFRDSTGINYINYINLKTGERNFYNIIGSRVAVSKTLLVFETEEKMIDADLNNDLDKLDNLIRYYDTSKSEQIHNTMVSGRNPSVCGDTIAFESWDSIKYFNISSSSEVHTIINAGNPSITQNSWNGYFEKTLIAFQPSETNPDGSISRDNVVKTFDVEENLISTSSFIGANPSVTWTPTQIIDEGVDVTLSANIAFQTRESKLGRDLNGDGDSNDNVIQYLPGETKRSIIEMDNYEICLPPPDLNLPMSEAEIRFEEILKWANNWIKRLYPEWAQDNSLNRYCPILKLQEGNVIGSIIQIHQTAHYFGSIEIQLSCYPECDEDINNLKLMEFNSETNTWIDITSRIDVNIQIQQMINYLVDTKAQ